MKSTGIDFFDVDHTLTQRSSGRHFILMGIKKRIFPARYLFSIPFYYIYYRYGNINIAFMEQGFPQLNGIRENTLENLSRESFEKKLKNDIYPEARVLIERLKQKGREIVFATSSLNVIVKPLAEYLFVENIIANNLEFKDGICTGVFTEAPIFGESKKEKVLQFIKEKGYSSADCSFYSDSIHDLPLLESVGNPVAVNPDSRLRRIANERGWEIINFK
ncbi:MAG: HAD family hydrolase [Spirochaetes bacterium]|nr:HAD family hydrolase [Spirochaetota bacterium]